MMNIEYETYEAIKSIARKYTRTDWETVRIKAAIAAMQGLLSADTRFSYTEDQIVTAAIKHADMLVNRLKPKDS